MTHAVSNKDNVMLTAEIERHLGSLPIAESVHSRKEGVMLQRCSRQPLLIQVHIDANPVGTGMS
jgi:hypothetical protein